MTPKYHKHATLQQFAKCVKHQSKIDSFVQLKGREGRSWFESYWLADEASLFRIYLEAAGDYDFRDCEIRMVSHQVDSLENYSRHEWHGKIWGASHDIDDGRYLYLGDFELTPTFENAMRILESWAAGAN